MRSFKEYLILALLVVVSVIILISNDTSQIRAIRARTIGLIGLLQSTLSIIPNVFEMQHENEVLHQINVNLSDEVSRLREARIENLRLREMLGLREHASFNLIAADVVGKNLNLLRNTITLSIGEDDGVKPDMPIISESGLVGKIIASSSHYSIGQLMLNVDFRASAKIQRSRVDGIVAWGGGDLLLLKNVTLTQDVKEGDLVLSSEYSTLFPPNLVIGTVSNVSDQTGSLFKAIDISPAVSFSALEHVFVIKALQDSERVSFENKIVPAR